MTDSAELEFVAKLRDEASREVAALRGNLTDLSGPVEGVDVPFTADTSDLDGLKGEVDAALATADDGAEVLVVADTTDLEGIKAEVDAAVGAAGSPEVPVDVDSSRIPGTVKGDVDEAMGEAERAAKAGGGEAGDAMAEGWEASFVGNSMADIAGELGSQVADALSASFEQAIEVDGGTAKLTASLGGTAEQSAKWGEVAGSLYSNAYGENMAEVQAGVDAVVSSIAGMRDASSADLEAATGKAMDFAAAFDTDVTTATQVAAQAINSGLAPDFTTAMDLMTASSQQVPQALRGPLLDAVNEYAPQMAQLGLTGEQAFGLLAAGAEQGEYGIDKAGDALKEFTILATDGSANEVLEGLGLDADEMANKILAGGDSAADGMGQIVDGLLGIKDPQEQANAAIALFGTPLEDLGTGAIPDFLASLSDAEGGLGDFEGTSQAVTDQLGGTASAQFEASKRELMEMGTGLMTDLLPHLTSFLTWVKETPGMLPALAIGLGVLAVAWAAMTLAASPWLLLGAAIALIVVGIVALIANWGSVMEWLGNLMQTIGDWIGQTWNSVYAAVSGFLGQIGDGIRDAWNQAYDWVVEKVTAIKDWIVNGFNSAKDGVVNAVTAAKDWVVNKFNEITTNVSNAVNATNDAVNNKFTEIKDGIVNKATEAKDWVVNKFHEIKDGMTNAVQLGKDAVIGKFQEIRSNINSAIQGARDTVIQKAIELKDGLIEKAQDALTWLQGLPGKAITAVGELGSKLFGAGKDLIQGFINGIKNMAQSVADQATSVARNAVNSVKSFLGIASPSKVFATIGEQTGQGFALGIGAMGDDVATEAGRLAALATDAASQAQTALSGNIATDFGNASVAAASTSSESLTVTIRHEVDVTGEGSEHLDAEQIARLILADPRAQRIAEEGVRRGTQQRNVRVLTGS